MADLTVIEPSVRDIGGFEVRRLLPARQRRTLGPFVFFDHMGPARLAPGTGVDVRPHPHIGLATVTYLFDGALMHRDSLGTVQRITPGDVNWMTAGRGIVHSERTPQEDRAAGAVLHGLQTWIALPAASERAEPAFSHHPAATLPQSELPGLRLRVIAGHAFGMRAPAPVFSDTLYVAVEARAGARLTVPAEHPERAVYVVRGEVAVDGTALPALHMGVVEHGTAFEVEARADALFVLAGGAPLDGPRRLWWNFVASDPAAIDEAAARWEAGGFDPVPGETERIPLPPR